MMVSHGRLFTAKPEYLWSPGCQLMMIIIHQFLDEIDCPIDSNDYNASELARSSEDHPVLAASDPEEVANTLHIPGAAVAVHH